MATIPPIYAGGVVFYCFTHMNVGMNGGNYIRGMQPTKIRDVTPQNGDLIFNGDIMGFVRDIMGSLTVMGYAGILVNMIIFDVFGGI